MNQTSLYATLITAGCKILSFEDFPSNQGSWRACFIKAGTVCDVTSNRFDGFLSVRAKSRNQDIGRSTVIATKFQSDDAELAYLTVWLMSFSTEDGITKHSNQVLSTID